MLSQAYRTLLHIESVDTNLFTNSGTSIKWSAPPPHKYMGLHLCITNCGKLKYMR
jgi:hypothetical protein